MRGVETTPARPVYKAHDCDGPSKKTDEEHERRGTSATEAMGKIWPTTRLPGATKQVTRTERALGSSTATADVPRWASAGPAAPGHGTTGRRQCKRRPRAEPHGEISPRGRRDEGGTGVARGTRAGMRPRGGGGSRLNCHRVWGWALAGSRCGGGPRRLTAERIIAPIDCTAARTLRPVAARHG